MDAEWLRYRDLLVRLGASVEAAYMAMRLAGPLGRAVSAKMVVDPSWLADPLSLAVLNTALAVAVLWAGGFWEPLR
jgi:hypothetical protein